MHHARAVIVIALLALGLAGCSTATGTPRPTEPAELTAAGSITAPVDPSSVNTTDGTCLTSSSYDDIDPGTRVVITDAAGKTVRVGHLSTGKVAANPKFCTFGFDVTGIPAGSTHNGVHIGEPARGVGPETPAQLPDTYLIVGD
jgi:hypothetical protein